MHRVRTDLGWRVYYPGPWSLCAAVVCKGGLLVGWVLYRGLPELGEPGRLHVGPSQSREALLCCCCCSRCNFRLLFGSCWPRRCRLCRFLTRGVVSVSASASSGPSALPSVPSAPLRRDVVKPVVEVSTPPSASTAAPSRPSVTAGSSIWRPGAPVRSSRRWCCTSPSCGAAAPQGRKASRYAAYIRDPTS